MTQALLGLGSNLGRRDELLAAALHSLDTLPHTRLLAHSRWHETRPIGGPPGQGLFLNGAASIETHLTPSALLAALRQCEAQAGRQRLVRWQARTLDLDLLLFGDLVLTTPDLDIPHPRMPLRRFVLEPAAEIAPHFVHPPSGRSVAQLLARLDAASGWLVILDDDTTHAVQLAQQLAERIPVQRLTSLDRAPWPIIAQNWRSYGAVAVSSDLPRQRPHVPSPMLIIEIRSPDCTAPTTPAPVTTATWCHAWNAPRLLLPFATPAEAADELSVTLAGMR